MSYFDNWRIVSSVCEDIYMTRFIALLGVVMLAMGCGQQSAPSREVSSASTPAVFNAAKLPTVAFNAPDMMCPDGCGEKVKEILSEQPGAKEVVVDFDNKMATVAIEDGSKFDSNAALAALADHGFKNSSVKNGDNAAAPTAGASDLTPPAAAEKPKGDSAG
jgi:copper chaperone CopZ